MCALTGRIFSSLYTSCLFLAGNPGRNRESGTPESIRGRRGGPGAPAQGRKGRGQDKGRLTAPANPLGGDVGQIRLAGPPDQGGRPSAAVGRAGEGRRQRLHAGAFRWAGTSAGAASRICPRGGAGFPFPPPLSPSLPSPFSRLGFPLLLAPCKSRRQHPGIKILPFKAAYALNGRIFSINLYCLFILARRIWRETGPSARRKACGEAVPIQGRKSMPTGEDGLSAVVGRAGAIRRRAEGRPFASIGRAGGNPARGKVCGTGFPRGLTGGEAPRPGRPPLRLPAPPAGRPRALPAGCRAG